MKFSEICQFQPKQKEAVRVAMENIFTLYGGAAGGGKSYALRWIGVYLLLYYAKKYNLKGVRVGLFCEDYPALRERQASKIEYEFPPWLGQYNKTASEFVLLPEWGSGVLALRNLDDPSKYLSSEFASILVDELTRNDRNIFNFLDMRRRWPGIDPRDCKFVGSTNPGGKGHGWVKKFWVDRDFVNERYNSKDFAFVQARARDNKYLGVAYEKQLDSLPEKLRKAYKDGDWNVFEGQFFTEWSNDIHVIEPFKIPEGWSKIRCLDYGFNAPSACYWVAVDFDSKLYVYRELYETGLTYAALAKRILEMTSDEEVVEYTAADTSMFAVTPDTGEYGQNVMADNGVPITPANKERIQGWTAFRQALIDRRIYFFKNCVNAIQTIPTLAHDEVRVEDLAKGSNDHCLHGDTFIHTRGGDKMIKDLVGTEGELISVDGVRMYKNVRLMTKGAQIYDVKFKETTIKTTDNHKFLTTCGWKRAKDLRGGDYVVDVSIFYILQSYLWKLKILVQHVKSLMVRGFISVADIMLKPIGLAGGGCIKLYGNIIMGISRTGSIYITRIIMLTTTIFPIWNFSIMSSMGRCIAAQKNLKRGVGEASHNTHTLKQRNGTGHQRGASGMLNMQKFNGRGGGIYLGCVFFVGKILRRAIGVLQSFVIRIVSKKRCVLDVRRGGHADVYDLEVPSTHCFAVNGGIIVHNSADAIRYGIMSLPPLPELKKEVIINPYENDPDSPWGNNKQEFNFNKIYAYTK